MREGSRTAPPAGGDAARGLFVFLFCRGIASQARRLGMRLAKRRLANLNRGNGFRIGRKVREAKQSLGTTRGGDRGRRRHSSVHGLNMTNPGMPRDL